MQRLFGKRYVGFPLARIVARQRTMHDLRFRFCEIDDKLGQLPYCELFRIA